jgi:hypothetical protein
MLYVIGTLSRDIEALFLIVDTVEAQLYSRITRLFAKPEKL